MTNSHGLHLCIYSTKYDYSMQSCKSSTMWMGRHRTESAFEVGASHATGQLIWIGKDCYNWMSWNQHINMQDCGTYINVYIDISIKLPRDVAQWILGSNDCTGLLVNERISVKRVSVRLHEKRKKKIDKLKLVCLYFFLYFKFRVQKCRPRTSQMYRWAYWAIHWMKI